MNGTGETARAAYLRPNADQIGINRFHHGSWAFAGARVLADDPKVW